MTLRLLGTGAADGIPAFYGDCRVCRHAREHRGREVRSRSAAVLDDILKIDLPPETLMQLQRDGLTAKTWTGLVYTHADDDHFAVEQLQYALHPFTDMDHLAFTIYANKDIVKRIWKHYPDWPLEVVAIKSFCPFEHAGYEIMPLRAKHGSNGEDAMNFLIEKDGRRLIYATDTGVWEDQTWFQLRDVDAHALVIECTDGVKPSDYDGHLNIEAVIWIVDRLRKQGSLSSDARVVTTHHSHRGDATHEELEALLKPHAIEPGYDGMSFEI